MIEYRRRDAPRTGSEVRGIVARFAPLVSPNARAVLLYLWTYAKPMEEPAAAYPSAVRIGRELGVSDRKVRDNLDRLVEVGAIERVQCKRERRRVWVLHTRAVTPASETSETGRQRPSQKPDPTEQKPDASVHQNRTPASTEDQGKKLEDQDPSRAAQASMPWAPEPGRDEVAELWSLQDRLRQEAEPACRGLALTSKRRSAVGARLRDHGREACEHVLSVYCSEAKRKGSVQWFNGVTNWRADNFERALSRKADGNDTPPDRGGFTPRDGGTDMTGGARAGLRLVRD